MEKEEYRPVSMRERDARQAKKFNQYVKGIEEYQARLLELLAKNEAEDKSYSSAQQGKIKSDLTLLSIVTNCHTFQSIQASDCVEDKELVFKEIQHIRESTKSIIESKNTAKSILNAGKWLGESARALVSSCLSFSVIYYFLIDKGG